MKAFLFALVCLAVLLFMAATAVDPIPVDVPAISYQTPASYSCNVTVPGSAPHTVLSVCVTEPETHWKCEDKARFLLTAEDDSKHCISLKRFDQ